MIKFAKPSFLRACTCVAVVAVFACVVAGIALYTAAIIAHSDPNPTPTGEYVRLFIVDITIWGPIALLTVWQISVPVIVAVGLFVACIRVVDAPSDQEAGTESESDSVGPATRDDNRDHDR
ncbi:MULTISPECIES: hypothetical protein [unclassified Mycolicibacterium]|uniref:hypothetical protein n=1 Tax=unclassified Mycolicibacterium TaxID=2636767 RepID=UPI0012DEE4C1|nr:MULTISPECIES: hypothetical protein [unclassified Mycolicibacterium]MUL84311.1 hypothetical protein [Mycolicibacterium sp. CBMA 329]MUL89623.1 hypothetical protein [Mycolicibacterium sp. CBMA 331]MUL99799.1 hypothetical protein [Mycolicibacterium sp. CBMA 334]MUM29814.1 hypothetical protein [Mycolicibacterium sp. CBMA 295]MUM39138.1 hypothetical protein [Mycolicibacterium sp. CBMA 247]